MKQTDFKLGDSATYSHRTGFWIPTPQFGGDGLLSITLVERNREAVQQDLYGCEEVQPEHFGTRRFLLVNLGDPDQQEPYAVTVGGMVRCTCEAGRKGFNRGTCKHVDALGHLVARKVILPKQIEGA